MVDVDHPQLFAGPQLGGRELAAASGNLCHHQPSLLLDMDRQSPQLVVCNLQALAGTRIDPAVEYVLVEDGAGMVVGQIRQHAGAELLPHHFQAKEYRRAAGIRGSQHRARCYCAFAGAWPAGKDRQLPERPATDPLVEISQPGRGVTAIRPIEPVHGALAGVPGAVGQPPALAHGDRHLIEHARGLRHQVAQLHRHVGALRQVPADRCDPAPARLLDHDLDGVFPRQERAVDSFARHRLR